MGIAHHKPEDTDTRERDKIIGDSFFPFAISNHPTYKQQQTNDEIRVNMVKIPVPFGKG